MREVRIEEAKLASAESFHALLAQQLNFPSYYGANLSALSDCLDEVDEPTRITVVAAPEGPLENAAELITGEGRAPKHAPWQVKVCHVMVRAANENPLLQVNFENHTPEASQAV